MTSMPRKTAKRVAVVSLHFSPAFASHMAAYGKLLRELGYSISFILDEKYLSLVDFSALGSVFSADRFIDDAGLTVVDIAIFCNAAVYNARVAGTMRRRGTFVLYVFHEPVPVSHRLSEGLIPVLKLIVAKRSSLLMLKQSNAVLLPSGFARQQYDRYYSRHNKNSHTLPLLFDDEWQGNAATPDIKMRRYFSFLGNAFKGHEFGGFVRFAKHAIRAADPPIEFSIATKTDLKSWFDRDKEFAGYAQEGKIQVQHGKVLSNDALNKCFRESFCVWNVYNCSTQSGVLPRAFMAGTPVLAKPTGSFPEYVIPGVNGEFVDGADDYSALREAAEKTRQNITSYVEGCRKTFLDTFYYKAHRERLAGILSGIGSENPPWDSSRNST